MANIGLVKKIVGYGNQKFGEQAVFTSFGKDFIFLKIKVEIKF